MRKYGEAAILATRLVTQGRAATPQEAWQAATAELFPNSPACQEKGCPKGAFLGLCQVGLVRGIRPGDYTKSKENSGYAIKAVKLLENNPSLLNDEKSLWAQVVNGADKAPNSQMEVVLSLWTEGLINLETEAIEDERQQQAVLRYSMKQASKVARENPY